MNREKALAQPDLTLRELYPELSESELQEVEENLERYLEVVLRIFNRISTEEDETAKPGSLTPTRADVTIESTKPEVS